jgi:hypothetical protein
MSTMDKLYQEESRSRKEVIMSEVKEMNVLRGWYGIMKEMYGKWFKQYIKWLRVKPYARTTFKPDGYVSFEIMRYAMERRTYVVDLYGGGESNLSPSEWRTKLFERNLTENQRVIIEYLKWESFEFRSLRMVLEEIRDEVEEYSLDL